MKNVFFSVRLLFIVLIIIAAGTGFHKSPQSISLSQKFEDISCAPSPSETASDVSGKFITILPGWGQHRYSISTKSDSTQFYFNQGLSYYYGYHFREALASFKEAARLDSTCGMAYWGQALAMGPYYNDYYYKMKTGVLEVLESMNSVATSASEKERALFHAMQQRYSTDITNADRQQLDSNYARAMSSLAKQKTSDDDVKALYIDAVMLAHKWDFWYNDGNPKPWTPEVVALCEEILQRNPNHPAALHYYIHLTEASKHPERALHSADVLKDAMPGVSHMVHMSTHMYQRNGLFTKAVEVNEQANGAGNYIDSLAPNLGIGRDKAIHFFAVQSYCAMTAGMFNKGMPKYLRVRQKVMELSTSVEREAYSQYLYMIPVLAWVRMGKWQLIQESSAPATNWKYASVLDNFARGMANVRTGKIDAAKINLSNLERNLSDSLLAIRLMPFNKPVNCGKIAAAILKSNLLFADGKTTEALEILELAVKEEDNLVYREPQDWPIPARQFLGAFLLKMNKAREAEEVYSQDLVANPGNGWSLLGMYQSLLAQKKSSQAAKFKKLYTVAFKSADTMPASSVY